MYFILLGLLGVVFAGALGGVIALAWTGKPIPPELGKAFTALGTAFFYGLVGAHNGGGDDAMPPSAPSTEVLPASA